MANVKVLAGVCHLMLLTALLAQTSISRLATAKPRRLPIEAFPAQVGQWQAGPVLPVDPEVQAKLSGAMLIERVYADGIHPPVDLLLVTSADSEDLHDPTTCFPTQGWRLSQIRRQIFRKQEVTMMDASQEEEHLSVLYWMTGYSQPVPRNAWLARLVALRTRFVGRHEGMSLFVRVMAPATADGRSGLQDFGNQIQMPVHALLQVKSLRRQTAVSRIATNRMSVKKVSQ